LEIIKNRLLRDFGLNVRVHKPRVSYRESVDHAAEVVGTCQRQQAGQSMFAKVRLRVEPYPQGSAPLVVMGPGNDGLPEDFLQAVLDVLNERHNGSLGCPLMKVKFTLLGTEAHETDSSEIAFRYAASDALNKALDEAGIVLLEPIMKLDITVPEENLGDFISDLQQRRATITHTQVRGRNTVIEALAPLANLFGYSSAMRGLSQGRATASMQPAAYGAAPPEVLAGFL
jgi:elongation factor G